MTFKMEEKDFNAFILKISDFVETMNKENVSDECSIKGKKLLELIECFNDVREISFQRKASYENYIKAKDANPEFAKTLYSELYIPAKYGLEKAKKRLEEKLYE